MAIDWEYYKKKAKKIDEENYRKNVSNDIAPVRTQTPTSNANNATEPKWFQKSALFDDGYDFGDVFKTIIGSGTDVTEHAGAGLIGSGEKILDALSMIGTAMNKQAMNQAAENEMIYNTIAGNDISGEQVLKKYKEIQNSVEKGSEEFIKKDLYDEQRIAKKLISDPMRKKHGIDAESDSIFGEKSDELAYSGGQLLGTAAASKLGVPSSVLIGLTSFGGEMESALNQGASYDEAAFSSAVTAGAEILTEKISGGIKFGGKTLDEALTKKITSSLSNKVVRRLVDFGMDAAGEGFEEVLSGVMSAIGQKLSYADDKELNELFSLQDALDAFIGGTVLGGFSSVGRNVKAKINGIDSVTGLTKDEQAVFDKVYNQRMAEAKKDGKKLSVNEKSNIFNSVMNDIEKGYIGIDTIESVLGGETYKQYQSAVEKDNSMKKLQKEYDSLYQMKNGDKSDAQIDRQAELKQQLEDYKNNSKLTQLKEQLSKEVSEMTKVGKLSESYNEKSRRSQVFEADLSQYDGKAQETVKRAVDSGILNNTNRTHEFVDMIAKLSADKGVLFDFTNNQKLKESSLAIEGKTVNGYVQGNNIAVNIDSATALNTVVGHEITHVLEGTELYTELANAVKELATTKGEYDSKLLSIAELYDGIENVNIENEVLADLIGEYLFTDTNFINNLSAEKPTLFKKIFDEIKYLYKVATAGSKEARQLEKVKKAFEDAYKQKNNTATNDGITRYSFNDSKGMANDKLMPYDEKLTSIIEQKGGYIIDSFEKLENVVNLAFDKPQQKATAYFGILSPDVLSHIEKNIPNLPKELNGELFKSNKSYSVAVTLDSIKHICDEKSLSKKDVLDYLDRMSDTIVNFDTVNFDYYYQGRQKSKGIIFKKSFEDGTIESFEIVSNKKKSLNLQTIYMEKGDYIKKKSAETLLMDNPSADAQGEGQSNFNNIISNTTENVKDVSKYLTDDMKMSLSKENQDLGPVRSDNVYGKDIKLQTESAEDIAPIGENVVRKTTPSESNIPDDYAPTADDIQKQDTPKIDLFVKSNKTVESEQATVLKETTPVEQSTIDEKAVERLTRKVIDGLDIGKTKKNRTAIGEIIKSFGDNYSATSKDALYDAVKEKFGTTYVDSVINKATDLIYNNVTEHREATSKVDKVTKDIESANISNKVKTEIKNQLTSAYEKIEAEYNIDKNNLVNELNARKSQLETDTADKNHFFKKYAGELYSELKQLKKGVRASDDLSYLLDSLDSKNKKPLVTALINAKNAPEGVVNENSEIERVVRELLNEKFDSYVDELNNFDSTAQEKLEKLETKAEDKRNYARLAVNGKLVREIMDAEQVSLMGKTSTWKDKKLGLWYKIETEKRNFEDIVKDSKGKADIEKAKALNDYFMGTYNHNEAELKRESNKIKKDFIDLKLNKHEDVFVQMKGEFLHNPHTELTQHDIDTFLNLYGKNIDEAKVDKAIDMARETYDSLIERTNEVLVAHGMKPIEYRKGYFPHFTEKKQGRLAKLLNWKTHKTNIPTGIADLTESFKPNRSWQSFNKRRVSDNTDYSFSKGFDRYLQGSLDWIYHIDDIMKRRVFENRIRYDHSDTGIKEKIQEIYKNNEFDTNEKQEQIDLVFREAKNPLNNFVTDFRTRTNTLAGKKSSMDRNMEAMLNRDVYSTMTNISNRVTANMVVGSVSSALTNFIPITQSWGEVSPLSSLRAMSDTIRSAVRDDGTIDKSDFLTNRLRQSENLYQTTWDKVIDKAGAMMEIIDNFTSQTVWRSKYLENISKGMSENAAIKNADQFAENVLAGRSRGNNPTIFDSKSILSKTLTAFQLEVNNQYGYMFKDMPRDLKQESIGKLVKGYGTMFIGAYAYNALYSALVGRNAAFDPMSIIEDLLKDLFGDDEKEPADIIMNLTDNVLEEVPFVGGLIDGGRIPISSVLPYDNGIYGAYEGIVTDATEKDLKHLEKEVGESFISYLLLPAGGGQIKKTVQGLSMFDDDFPIAGSYTDSGKLRFSVEKTPGNIAQAALFGQYASKTAQQYFDEEHAPLSDKQTEELSALEISMEEYWNYQKGLKKLGDDATLAEQVDFIANLEEFDTWQKNIMANSLTDRKTPIDLTGYEAIGDFEEFDYSIKHPEKYAIAKAVGGYDSYIKYSEHLGNITAEKDRNGKTVSGSRKKKVARYINNLDIEFGEKMILYKSEYKGDDIYNAQIVEYLNGRNDITYQEKITILTELGFNVLSDGTVRW